MVERDRIISAVEEATYASSIHNSQPWRFRIEGEAVSVLLDASQTPRTVDPQGRWALASIGAVVANLEIALSASLGVRVSTDVRLAGAPPLGDLAGGAGYADRPLAVVSITGTPLESEELARVQRLAGAVRERFTTREPLRGGAPSDAEWASVRGAVAAGQGEVEALAADAELCGRLLALTATAETERQDDPDYLEEIEQWISNSSATGIPRDAVGLPDADGRVPTRDFTQTPMGSAASGEAVFFEPDPFLAVLVAPDDSPRAQLFGGYAMQRAMLAATALGLGIGVLGQGLEEQASRALVDADTSRSLGREVVVHQILRLGHPAGELHNPHTPRRPVAEVILD